MARLEEITYEAGRHALADQEALVAGIMQRTGMLLAAHALVASFLGAAVQENTETVRLMSRLSGALGTLMIVQTLAWLAALAVA